MARPLEVDLTGMRFGRLTVTARAPNRHGKVYWSCRCDCGNVSEVQTFDLIMGHTRSCGCYQRERARETCHIGFQRNPNYKHRAASRCMDLYREFDADSKTISYPSAKTYAKGRARAGQMFDSLSTTLHFNHIHHVYDEGSTDPFLDSEEEWDFRTEGYYPYIIFRIYDEHGYPLCFGDSSSPVFDGYTFEIPYAITSRIRSVRVEYQLCFVRAALVDEQGFDGVIQHLDAQYYDEVDKKMKVNYLLSAIDGIAFNKSIGPDPRRGPAGAPMSPISCEPSVMGWIEKWKDRGVLLPVDLQDNMKNGKPAGYAMTFATYRGELQTLELLVPVMKWDDELGRYIIKVDDLPVGNVTGTIPLLQDSFTDGDVPSYSVEKAGFAARSLVTRGDHLADDGGALPTASAIPQKLVYRKLGDDMQLVLEDGNENLIAIVVLPPFAVKIEYRKAKDTGQEALYLIDSSGTDTSHADIPSIPTRIEYRRMIEGVEGLNFIALLDSAGSIISYTDMPMEKLIESAEYDAENNSIVFRVRDGDDISVPLDDLMVIYTDSEGYITTQLRSPGGGSDKTYYDIHLSDAFWTEVGRLDKAVRDEMKAAIDSEAATRLTADNTLDAKIDQAEADITAETSKLVEAARTESTTADNRLEEKINKVASDLSDTADAITTAWKQGDAEVTAAWKAADAIIQAGVDTNKQDITELDSRVESYASTFNSKHADYEKQLYDHQAGIGDLNSMMKNVQVELSEKQDRLSSDGNVKIVGSGNSLILRYDGPDTETSIVATSQLPVASSAIYTALAQKQDRLTAGTNIDITEKDGKVVISSSPAVTVDDVLTADSANPVSSRAIAQYLKHYTGSGTGGIPTWAEGVAYESGAVVQYDYTLYISMVDDNNLPPTTSQTWSDTDHTTGVATNRPYWIAIHGGTFTPGAVTQPTYIGIFGNDTDTTYTIRHNLGCRELVWSMYTNDVDHLYVQATVSAPTINTFKVRLSSPPGDNGLVISIIRARTTAVADGLTAPTVLNYETAAETWSYDNPTGKPLYVQCVSTEGDDLTDVVGDVIQNSASIPAFSPVTVSFADGIHAGTMLVAPASAVVDADLPDNGSITISKADTEGLEKGSWYLVQCYVDGEGESVLDVHQDDESITVNTGGAWQGLICMYKATGTKVQTEASQVWEYQHNKGRYVGVQAYPDGDEGLAGTTVTYISVNKISVDLGTSQTGHLLIL